MMTFDVLGKCDLRRQLDDMEEMLLSACDEAGKPMCDDLRRVIGAGGKRLRPTLAWLCWRMSGGKTEILPLMCILEMMHTASLIHDDVVDNACQRRNTPTINAQRGAYAAVQCGDFLLAKSLEYVKPYREMGIAKVLSELSTQMCLGEFQQMGGLYSVKEQTIARYEAQIKQKTAYFFGASCYCGALAGGASQRQAASLRRFGEYLGIAFQMEDDLLDFAPDARTGKPAGQDIRNGIFTIPVLHAVKECPDERIVALLEKREKNEGETEEILNFIEQVGGIRYTREQILAYSGKAIDSLQDFPDTEEKAMLCDMVYKLVERRS